MFRKVFFWLHKWLGLITGIVVLIVSLTGCINVFADELKTFFYRDRLYVTDTGGGTFRDFSELRQTAQQALGADIKVTRAEIYPDGRRNWIFRATLTDKDGIGYWNYNKYYYRVYVNPYTGKVVYIENTLNEFFQIILSLHRNLLLGDTVGGIITGGSSLCFFLLLLSGLVLWFPRKWKKKAFKRGFALKMRVGIKRLIYDIHNVFGFYIIIPGIIISVTGMVFAFEWADKSVQYVANGGTPYQKIKIPLSSPNPDYHRGAADSVLKKLLHDHQDADIFSVRFRDKETDPLDVQVRLAKNRTHLFMWYYFDRNTGELLLRYGDQDIRGGQKLRTMNYDLHTGAYSGIPTKLFYFFVSLICAGLPITGFIMWYNHKGKPAKRTKSPAGRYV
ncbi:PepSY-associated TM helix domain-containing protein [Pedobacter deserti]|uniref:PepSY-associated TM helix domain-containing protein n=1 Tax=Pedobacter deserti TaxID=2817382 RepID=UPI0021091C87